jgi:tetratricopeptide (TPR) repeat protein
MLCSIAVAAGATRVRVPVATAGDATSATRSTRASGSFRRVSAVRACDEHASWKPSDASVALDFPLARRAARAAAAAALSLTLAFATPDASLAKGAASPSAPASDPSFGDSLLERRRVEEGVARANLDGVMADIREEEARLKALRFEREAESVRTLQEIRTSEEQKARAQIANGNTLCVTPFGVDVVGITQTVALIGAIGAGLTSNARKAEIAELNEKLRLVNSTLRAQIRQPNPAANGASQERESVGSAGEQRRHVRSNGPMDSMDLEDEVKREARLEASGSDPTEVSLEETESDDELRRALRDGRALLKEDTEASYRRSLELFEKALTLARMVGDTTQARRATRGLAASKRGLGDGKGAVFQLKRVLEMRASVGDAAGDTDALGAIADIYTEMGDLENAGKYYDLYLDALNREMLM